MTAADRRQKFHQSRLGVAPENVYSTSTYHSPGKQNVPFTNMMPYYAVNYNAQIQRPCPVVFNISPKTLLPYIKGTATTNITSASVHHMKRKCLLGEITHFPALCNGLGPKTQPKVFISSVPHLPPIPTVQEPVVPPPSLSTSVENEGHKGTVKI
ncbi:uncharacterized protein LOC129218075 [Uloborus diversus]|uniref:uncharacterized protein LOC129218075 n=1 Tax=Uloborus diversus TaxID=327109 RepID=UPI0024091B79|nr:uncharacterized protein LOC129218075 [Uloborus diversus]